MNRENRIKGYDRFNSRRFLSALGLSLLLVFGQTAPLLGNPAGGAVVAGSATIGSAGPTLTINQSTRNAIINWQQFSIAGGELTKFIVPNSSSATLNRVLGGNPSAIYGMLQSNGVVYLVNPSGIVVGPGGRIDTAGFLASTTDISNQQFLQGGNLSLAGAGAAIDNEGTIHASMGDVYLIANQVSNNGTISAPRGTVGLAAGTDILFQQSGNNHLFVQATPAGTKRAVGVTNGGTISAAAAELKAAGGNAYALAINNTGAIVASGYKKVNGQVYLTADGGSITNSGRISAQTANGHGGAIVVDGTAVTSPTSGVVTNSGTLDASASAAGGKGGSVTLKNMEGETVDSGKIVAEGGVGGVGGDAEVSGANLSFTGTVDLTAPNGEVGDFLLDPTTLDVVTGGGSNLTAATVDPTAVVAALNGANVTLQATNSITVDNQINASNNGSAGNLALDAPTLTLNAGIVLEGSSVLSGTATVVNVGAGGLVQNAVDAASTTATASINLASGATYDLTSEISIGKSLALEGNGATLNAQSAEENVVYLTSGAAAVTLSDLTLENGYIGIYDYNTTSGAALTLNNVAITGNSYIGLYNPYTGVANTVNLTNCTITNNDTSYDYYGAGGIYNGGGTMTLTNCTISGNGNATYAPNAGGIYNGGTLNLDSATAITGNTGYYTGGIYNSGTIVGTVNSSQVHGNTATDANGGTDFYNTGTATFAYNPDGEANNTLTITQPIYSSGAGAVITIDPSIQTLNVNADINSTSSATFNSSATTVNINSPMQTSGGVFNSAATTVNVAAGGGTENGYLAQAGVALAGSGATVNLTPSTTYNFDGTTGGLSIGQSLTLEGNGATLDAQVDYVNVVSLGTGANAVTLNNLTVENGDVGVYAYYYNSTSAVALNLNNVTIAGNYGTGLYDATYSTFANTVNLTDCTISNNSSNDYYGSAGGIYNANATMTLTNCTISGNGNATYVADAGGIYNGGTLNLDSATTITGNTGYYTGGIYNFGTIVGTVNSSQVHGNTETDANGGTDFYNTGTATFAYNPDGEANNTLTIMQPIYSSGAGAVITIDPSIQTLNVNADINSTGSATFNSSATTVNINAPMQTNGGIFNSAATTVNVAAGSGTENGYLAQAGVALAGSGATVNLTPSTTYNFDGTTGGLSIGQSLTLEGNGATLDAQVNYVNVVSLATGGNAVTLNNLTVENGDLGVYAYYYNSTSAVALNLNNVTITGNYGTGLYDATYSTFANTVNLTNCTISNNGTSNDYYYYYGAGGGIYNANATLTLTNCTISGNGNATYVPTAGGIYNGGTLNLDSATTITGNTGYYTGGIYNYGTIVGTVNSSQVHGNTATSTDLADAGTDFYNTGTATFAYNPDGEANNTLTITQPIYSSGSGAVITIDPSIQTLNVNADINNIYSATFNSSAATVNINAPMQISEGVFNSAATTVNVAAGSGTENGYLVEAGVALAGNGATVNLTPGTTYNFDGTTGGLSIGQSLTLEGNGATLNAQGDGEIVVSLTTGAVTDTLNDLTVENGETGIEYYNTANGAALALNNVTITGNSSTGLYNYDYYGYANTVSLTNCTISNNDTNYDYGAGGIYNANGTMTLTNCTISNNGNATYAPTAGGIYNEGTLILDSATTITGNTGYYTGGIYNYGTIVGAVNSSQVHGNTATSTALTAVGTDFYNTGTATFAYNPDGEANNTLTITQPIYSSGSGAVITIDPSIQTLNINADINSTYSATFNSSAATVNINAPMQTSGGVFNSAATTVNVAAGSGTENGYFAEAGVALAGSGATVNLAPGTTYNFDDYTGGLVINQSLTLEGNGATLNAQANGDTVVSITAGAVTDTLNNLTLENGSIGIDFYNTASGAALTLNNVTITGNSSTGFYDDYYYYGYANTVNLNNCTISNNDTSYGYGAGGIYNGNGTLTLTNCTISNNGNATYLPTAGGIYNEGTLNLNQTTISGNQASSAGGVYNAGTCTAIDCTFSGNVGNSGANDFYNIGTYTCIADGNAAVPNTINYTTSDYNAGTATYQATTINWNVPFTNNGYLTIDPTGAGSVTINSPITNSGGLLLIQAPVITLNAAITSTQGNIVLVDSSQFVNNAGSGALSATNGNIWQVWSANPPGSGQSTVDNDGGLVPDFIQYGATYGVTSAAAAGNGLLYSYGPVLTASVIGPITKVYDGTPNLTIAANSYTVSGLVALDSVTSGALTGTFNSKDVDTANTVTLSAPVLVSSITQGSIPVYGYTTAAATVPGTITPAPVTAGLTGTVTKTYDTTTTAPLTGSNYTLTGVLASDTVSLNDPPTGTYASPNVGSNIPVAVSGLALLGSDADDYSLASTTVSAPIGTIVAAGVNPVLGLLTGTVSKVYDGTRTVTNLTSANYTLSGVMGGDVVTLTGPATGTYASPNVGTGITVTSSTGLGLSGPQAGNYYLTNSQASGPIGIITPATLTYTATPATSTYGATLPVLTGTVSGFVNGETLASATTGALMFTTTATATSNVGSYAVNGGGLTANNGNYTFAQAMGNATALTIYPAGLDPVLGLLTGTVSKVYDGTLTVANLTSANYTLSGVLGNDVVTLTGPATGTYASPNVGTGITVTSSTGLVLSGPQSGNYYLTNSQASGPIGIITPAPLTITVGRPPGTPSGQTIAFEGTELTFTGLQNHEMIGTVTPADEAGSSYPIMLSAPNGGPFDFANYTISDPDVLLTIISPQIRNAGPNVVPAVVAAPRVPQAPLPGGGLLGGATGQPAISTVGSGVAVQAGQQAGGLADSSGNSGQVGKDDVAQLGNGQVNNVDNPHASGALNLALGPVVFHTLQDALQSAGDFADMGGAGADTDTAGTDATAPGGGDDETILSGGDVAEVDKGSAAKRIPLSQAPPQLRQALAGDVLKGLGSTQ